MHRPSPQIISLTCRLARAVAHIVAECNQATRRMTELSAAPDRYVLGPDPAPGTYAEFLYRTSGALRHEPPAASISRKTGAPSPRVPGA